MARIRTIKPELWTDPDFIECSLSARLLLIALLNFASDYGVLPDKPKQLKMQCLPADTVDIEPLIDELIDARFLIRRNAPDGAKVLVIRTFVQHQKVNRPTSGRWGNPDEWDNPTPPKPADSVTTHGELTEPSCTEGKGTGRELEGKGREGNSDDDRADNSDSGDPDVGSSSFRAVDITRKAALIVASRKQSFKSSRSGFLHGTFDTMWAERRDEIIDLATDLTRTDDELALELVDGPATDYLSDYASTEPQRHDLACRACGGSAYVPDTLDAHGEPAPGCRWQACTEPYQPGPDATIIPMNRSTA